MPDIDSTFGAMADPTRRAILTRLAEGGEATVADLAAPFAMTQPAVSQHLKVLERAGLIIRRIDGQRVPAAALLGLIQRDLRARPAVVRVRCN